MHARAARPNLFIKIPGTPQGLPAIEQSIFAGVPINVTLLFSREHYLAAAEAYLRGIERRVDAGLSPRVQSVASLFVSRWDAAVKQEISPPFHNRLGIAVAMRCYKAHCELLASARWRRLAAAGARPKPKERAVSSRRLAMMRSARSVKVSRSRTTVAPWKVSSVRAGS